MQFFAMTWVYKSIPATTGCYIYELATHNSLMSAWCGLQERVYHAYLALKQHHSMA